MKFLSLSLITLLTTVLIAACSTAPSESQWPSNIPARSVFTDYYAQDHKHQEALNEQGYLTWVHRFYFGWELYRRGWLQATQELVDSLPTEEEKAIGKERMETIGNLIAPEWAKDKRYHLISTRHLSIWGNTLNDAVIHKEQLLKLDSILADVQGLLSKEIAAKEITAERYYPQQAFGSNMDF